MSGRTAVYRLYGADDALLYIGLSRRLHKRWNEHSKIKSWWPDVVRSDVSWYDTYDDAAVEERRAILAEDPQYNRARVPIYRETVTVVHPPAIIVDVRQRLAGIRDARTDYDRSREQLLRHIHEALDEARELPAARKRELSMAAIGRAARFTREYISQIRDTATRHSPTG